MTSDSFKNWHLKNVQHNSSVLKPNHCYKYTKYSDTSLHVATCNTVCFTTRLHYDDYWVCAV